MHAIEIKNLKKTYKGGVEALKGISFTVKTGEFFGLLGPNGAGKSTTIGILCSLVNKTSGQVEICGYNIDTHWAEAKQYLGVVPQEFNFNVFLPCNQIVVNQAGFYGVPQKTALKRAKELFIQLGLQDKWQVPAGELSGGMKRRLMIARALIHNPQILILDEPTAGVDISVRRSMYTFLEDQNKNGLTIVLTTHYLEEAESLCKQIGIINQGELIEYSETSELLQKLHKETIILYTNPIADLPKPNDFGLKKTDDCTIEADLTRGQSIGELIRILTTHGIVVNRFKNKANRLEELFVKIVEENSK